MTDIYRQSIRSGLAVAAFLMLPLIYALAEDFPRQALTPRLEQLRAEHLRVLEQLNEKNASGNVMELDDPKIPDLVRKGWNLAGEWAAEYLETHPAPSARDLKPIFEDFAPKPQGVKSKHGDFLNTATTASQAAPSASGPQPTSWKPATALTS
jgi:hypothetical protein